MTMQPAGLDQPPPVIRSLRRKRIGLPRFSRPDKMDGFRIRFQVASPLPKLSPARRPPDTIQLIGICVSRAGSF
jgi:hypothetical protein